jgi:hypothetical protein
MENVSHHLHWLKIAVRPLRMKFSKKKEVTVKYALHRHTQQVTDSSFELEE